MRWTVNQGSPIPASVGEVVAVHLFKCTSQYQSTPVEALPAASVCVKKGIPDSHLTFSDPQGQPLAGATGSTSACPHASLSLACKALQKPD